MIPEETLLRHTQPAPQASSYKEAPPALQASLALQALPVRMEFASRPLTTVPHMPELPRAAGRTSCPKRHAKGDAFVSSQDRIALLERAPTMFEPVSDD